MKQYQNILFIFSVSIFFAGVWLVMNGFHNMDLAYNFSSAAGDVGSAGFKTMFDLWIIGCTQLQSGIIILGAELSFVLGYLLTKSKF